MNWEIKVFPARSARPASEQSSPAGPRRFPARGPIPQRDSYLAVSAAESDSEVTSALVEYWQKVAEILPRYYGGRDAPDPLAHKVGLTLQPDPGWNRVVIINDSIYGKLTTHLWAGDQQPRQADRVWIILKCAKFESPPDETEERHASLDRMSVALADAAQQPAAARAVAALRRWRDLSFWIMEAEDPETIRPLAVDLGRTT
jgi:hypothetical protein